ncbi:hypothetical protein [Caldalkalibacillus mannanilyticus]|uniref:hypothetical protein n=1 Tax=Caldalkalibacillus mannanilyticus TaxID=1418 RepID=UPI000469926D|nr:hypothetical protein [Caldalkalibacillus mannanilyticus]
MNYCLIQEDKKLRLISIVPTHMYQFTALIFRLHKEVNKLTVDKLPLIPEVLLECNEVEVAADSIQVQDGLEYINELEARFAALKEENYPLISLLTEIRAFQAQLEYLLEEQD